MTEKKVAPKAGRDLRVTASLVQVKTVDDKVIYFQAGDVFPAAKASAASLELLEELGFVEPA